MRFQDWKYPEIREGELTAYHWLVQHREGLRLGYRTDIGAFTYINAMKGVIIEDYVQIGSHCSLYSLSTIDGREGRILLQRNCRIGTHSAVMPGVTVGRNSIVGAFSLVNRDIPPNVVAFGSPARVRRNLSPEEIASMEAEAK
jgi:acetyltransferase-like isoleucine patch superfamily enzyme